MEMNDAAFLKEKAQVEQLPESEQKAYYARWLEVHPEKTVSFVKASLSYANLLYREGAFRRVMEVLMPIIMNHHAYPYCDEMITCFNQMGLAVNCEVEYSLARHFFQLALEIAEEHHVTSVYAKQHNNIGLTYHDQFDYEAAVREYEQAEVWLPETSMKEFIYPMVYGNWSISLLRLHRWNDALDKYHKALKYQPADEPVDAETISLGMILYYNLGMQEEYQTAKREFLASVEQKEIYSNVYYRLWEFQIEADNQEFMDLLFRHLKIAITEHPEQENWKSRSNACDMLYARAQAEGDYPAMVEALKRKDEVQNDAVLVLEKKRQDALNEYIDISAEKQEALERAEKATRAKSQFLSNMSHDIRTPMNAIYGITQLMEFDKNDPAKMDDHIQKLQSSSQHLLSLINDVLDMSKIESTEVTLNRESINLAEQVAQLESIICPQVEERRQDFTIHIHSIRHEYLLGDAVRLRQILINLLSNAVKYTPNGGTIRLDLTEKAGEDSHFSVFTFSVTDTGCGMSAEFIEHIFEPFTRAESSLTNKVQGTGLGMAITKNIVELMDGTISVTSELGKGSCFTVTIPLEIDTETVIDVPFEHILMIAEDESLLQNAVTAFHGVEFHLETARSVEEAETLPDADQAQVILLAGHYPPPELAAAARRLKALAGSAELVFCVDYDQKNITREMLETCGIRKVLTRPIFLTEITTLLNQLAVDPEAQNQPAENMLKGMNFLCAEDNALNAEILAAMLEMEGASCTILPDGKQLVEKFRSVKPGEYNAILMDMQMPVMNGLDATRAIRKGENPLGKTIPIIAMTANAFSSDVQDCLNAGMDAHLSKPLDLRTLRQTLHNLMGQNCSRGGDDCSPHKDAAADRPVVLEKQTAALMPDSSQQRRVQNEVELDPQIFPESRYL